MRVVVRAIAVVVLLALTGAVAALVAVDQALSRSDVKTRIETAATSFLGRPLEIESIEWSGWRRGVLTASNVRLWEDTRRMHLMAEAPTVQAQLSILSLPRLSVGVSELKFIRPVATFRRPDGRNLNLRRMIEDINRREKAPRRKLGALLFNWFVIEGGRVNLVLDGPVPVSRLEGVNGKGKLKFELGRAEFPFEVVASLDAPTTFPASSSGVVALNGTLSSHPTLRARIRDVPLAWAVTMVPLLARWDGIASGTISARKRRSGWRGEFAIAADGLRRADGPLLPPVRIEGAIDPRKKDVFTGVAESIATRIAVVTRIDRRSRRLYFDVRSPRSDLLELVRWSRTVAASVSAAPEDGSRKAWGIDADLALSTCAIPADRIDEALLHITYSTGAPVRVDIRRLTGLGGSATGQFVFDAARSTEALAWTWKAVDLDANRFSRLVVPSGPVTGRCDVEGSMTAAVGSSFTSTLNGRVNLSFRDGSIEEIPAVLKTVSKLNLTSLMNELRGSARRSHLPFRTATARIRFDDGKARTEEPFVLENNTLQMGFMGTVDIPARTVDGSIVVNVLTIADEVIGTVPGLRAILLGDKKSFAPIFLKVKGPLSDPDVKVETVKSITAPVWNTIGRVFRLPATLLDALTGKDRKND